MNPTCKTADTTRRLAIVTGGAGSLGRAFCRRLADRGRWHIVVADTDQAGAAATLAEIDRMAAGVRPPEAHSTAEAVLLDVTQRSDWRVLRDRLKTSHRHLHLLVHCAGICASGEVALGDADQWKRVLEVNFLGTLWGSQIMLEWLLASQTEHPTLVHVASIAGILSAPAMGAYNASKSAVLSLSETLYGELRFTNVSVRVVAPGFFSSGLFDGGDFAEKRHREQADQLAGSSKFTADDVARAALAPDAGLYVIVGRRARWLGRWKRLAPRLFLDSLARRYRELMEE